ncbi:MAG TPA: hypothetical protein VM509_02270, partial [Planctomycetota bacterium]|nr:hypothetical protein [Planctomycetota bacterium]
MTIAAELEACVAHLNVDRSGGKRKPHKPLLLLYAIGRLAGFQQIELPFEQVRSALLPLLGAYAPPVKASHQPELPYWHLRSDHVWEVTGAHDLELQEGGFPRIAGLRKTCGRNGGSRISRTSTSQRG